MVEQDNKPIAILKRKYAQAFDGQAMQSLAKRCAGCGFEEKVRDKHLENNYKQALTVVLSAAEIATG